jgi:hypothetical protein
VSLDEVGLDEVSLDEVGPPQYKDKTPPCFHFFSVNASRCKEQHLLTGSQPDGHAHRGRLDGKCFTGIIFLFRFARKDNEYLNMIKLETELNLFENTVYPEIQPPGALFFNLLF